jgi:hypothetical protein
MSGSRTARQTFMSTPCSASSTIFSLTRNPALARRPRLRDQRRNPRKALAPRERYAMRARQMRCVESVPPPELPGSLLRLLPAGAVAGWGSHHWKAPPCHGAHLKRSFQIAMVGPPPSSDAAPYALDARASNRFRCCRWDVALVVSQCPRLRVPSSTARS